MSARPAPGFPAATPVASGPTPRRADFSLQAAGTGALVALVGFASSFAIVLEGMRSVGASEAEAASALAALSIAMGLSGAWLAWTRRMPISVAWSTPGAALLIVSGNLVDDFEVAVGAFVATGALLVAAGAIRPLGRLMESIPASLANAMLAGILLTLCLAPVRALGVEPLLAASLLGAWWLAGRAHRLAAVPVALAVLVALAAWRFGVPRGFGRELAAAAVPSIAPVRPAFEPAALLGVALPLFVVTMASQNVPGVAVQRANGYRPAAGPLVLNTGAFSLAAAPFGGGLLAGAAMHLARTRTARP